MARGSTTFEFDYHLGGVVILQCVASIRAGKVQTVTCHYGEKGLVTFRGAIIPVD